MNCTEARVLLAAHRELKHVDVDTTELDEHLEQCSSCREMLARYSLIGEQVRALPRIEPPPERHASLMKALAVEHFQFMQHFTSAPPPPAFLEPYLQEPAHADHQSEILAAFSTAETGPLPILKPTPKKRFSPFRQYAAIGLAAVFLMTLMVGGITSLLLLAHDHINSETGQAASVNQPTDVISTSYTTDTVYQHIVSAVGDRTSIYYTAYGDGSNDGWMLEQLDRSTRFSTPLLAAASPSPLIVLGSENGWLVWLQFNAPGRTNQGNIPYHNRLHPLLRAWSLHYMSLTSQGNAGSMASGDPLTLVSGTFDQEAAPNWIHSPVQGVWFIQNSLLVALIDDNGISHLKYYPLGTSGNSTAREIATANPNHIFTSPTANSDGSQIYWSEEWRTADNNLHSNVWTQQIIDNPVASHGKQVQETTTIKQLFLSDGMSFRPVVVDETLFLLSSADGLNATQTTPTVTAQATQSDALTPTATPNTSTPGITWADTSIYTAPLDNGIRGSIIMFPLNSDPTATPTLVSTMGSASDLQAGADFVLWQAGDGNYGMYDVKTRTYITVGDVLNGAQFLAINGDTAVWTIDMPSSSATPEVNPSATLLTFNWPRK